MKDLQQLLQEELDENLILVVHENNTSDETPDGGSWLDYWKEHTKQSVPIKCPCCGENATDDNPMVGAHVVKVINMTNPQSQKYITPTCRKCNSTYKGVNASTKTFQVQLCYLCEVSL